MDPLSRILDVDMNSQRERTDGASDILSIRTRLLINECIFRGANEDYFLHDESKVMSSPIFPMCILP